MTPHTTLLQLRGVLYAAWRGAALARVRVLKPWDRFAGEGDSAGGGSQELVAAKLRSFFAAHNAGLHETEA